MRKFESGRQIRLIYERTEGFNYRLGPTDANKQSDVIQFIYNYNTSIFALTHKRFLYFGAFGLATTTLNII